MDKKTEVCKPVGKCVSNGDSDGCKSGSYVSENSADRKSDPKCKSVNREERNIEVNKGSGNEGKTLGVADNEKVGSAGKLKKRKKAKTKEEEEVDALVRDIEAIGAGNPCNSKPGSMNKNVKKVDKIGKDGGAKNADHKSDNGEEVILTKRKKNKKKDDKNNNDVGDDYHNNTAEKKGDDMLEGKESCIAGQSKSTNEVVGKNIVDKGDGNKKEEAEVDDAENPSIAIGKKVKVKKNSQRSSDMGKKDLQQTENEDFSEDKTNRMMVKQGKSLPSEKSVGEKQRAKQDEREEEDEDEDCSVTKEKKNRRGRRKSNKKKDEEKKKVAETGSFEVDQREEEKRIVQGLKGDNLTPLKQRKRLDESFKSMNEMDDSKTGKVGIENKNQDRKHHKSKQQKSKHIVKEGGESQCQEIASNFQSPKMTDRSSEETSGTSNIEASGDSAAEKQIDRVEMMFSRLSPQQNISTAIRKDRKIGLGKHVISKETMSCTEPRSIDKTNKPELVIQEGLGITSVDTLMGVESGVTINKGLQGERQTNVGQGASGNPSQMYAQGSDLPSDGYVNKNNPNSDNIYYQLQQHNWGMREDTDWAFIYLDTSSGEDDDDDDDDEDDDDEDDDGDGDRDKSDDVHDEQELEKREDCAGADGCPEFVTCTCSKERESGRETLCLYCRTKRLQEMCPGPGKLPDFQSFLNVPSIHDELVKRSDDISEHRSAKIPKTDESSQMNTLMGVESGVTINKGLQGERQTNETDFPDPKLAKIGNRSKEMSESAVRGVILPETVGSQRLGFHSIHALNNPYYVGNRECIGMGDKDNVPFRCLNPPLHLEKEESIKTEHEKEIMHEEGCAGSGEKENPQCNELSRHECPGEGKDQMDEDGGKGLVECNKDANICVKELNSAVSISGDDSEARINTREFCDVNDSYGDKSKNEIQDICTNVDVIHAKNNEMIIDGGTHKILKQMMVEKDKENCSVDREDKNENGEINRKHDSVDKQEKNAEEGKQGIKEHNNVSETGDGDDSSDGKDEVDGASTHDDIYESLGIIEEDEQVVVSKTGLKKTCDMSHEGKVSKVDEGTSVEIDKNTSEKVGTNLNHAKLQDGSCTDEAKQTDMRVGGSNTAAVDDNDVNVVGGGTTASQEKLFDNDDGDIACSVTVMTADDKEDLCMDDSLNSTLSAEESALAEADQPWVFNEEEMIEGAENRPPLQFDVSEEKNAVGTVNSQPAQFEIVSEEKNTERAEHSHVQFEVVGEEKNTQGTEHTQQEQFEVIGKENTREAENNQRVQFEVISEQKNTQRAENNQPVQFEVVGEERNTEGTEHRQQEQFEVFSEENTEGAEKNQSVQFEVVGEKKDTEGADHSHVQFEVVGEEKNTQGTEHSQQEQFGVVSEEKDTEGTEHSQQKQFDVVGEEMDTEGAENSQPVQFEVVGDEKDTEGTEHSQQKQFDVVGEEMDTERAENSQPAQFEVVGDEKDTDGTEHSQQKQFDVVGEEMDTEGAENSQPVQFGVVGDEKDTDGTEHSQQKQFDVVGEEMDTEGAENSQPVQFEVVGDEKDTEGTEHSQQKQFDVVGEEMDTEGAENSQPVQFEVVGDEKDTEGTEHSQQKQFDVVGEKMDTEGAENSQPVQFEVVGKEKDTEGTEHSQQEQFEVIGEENTQGAENNQPVQFDVVGEEKNTEGAENSQPVQFDVASEEKNTEGAENSQPVEFEVVSEEKNTQRAENNQPVQFEVVSEEKNTEGAENSQLVECEVNKEENVKESENSQPVQFEVANEEKNTKGAEYYSQSVQLEVNNEGSLIEATLSEKSKPVSSEGMDDEIVMVESAVKDEKTVDGQSCEIKSGIVGTDANRSLTTDTIAQKDSNTRCLDGKYSDTQNDSVDDKGTENKENENGQNNSESGHKDSKSGLENVLHEHSLECLKLKEKGGSGEQCKCFSDCTNQILNTGFGTAYPKSIEKILEGIDTFHVKQAVLAKQKLDKVCEGAFHDYGVTCADVPVKSDEDDSKCISKDNDDDTEMESESTSSMSEIHDRSVKSKIDLFEKKIKAVNADSCCSAKDSNAKSDAKDTNNETEITQDYSDQINLVEDPNETIEKDEREEKTQFVTAHIESEQAKLTEIDSLNRDKINKLQSESQNSTDLPTRGQSSSEDVTSPTGTFHDIKPGTLSENIVKMAAATETTALPMTTQPIDSSSNLQLKEMELIDPADLPECHKITLPHDDEEAQSQPEFTATTIRNERKDEGCAQENEQTRSNTTGEEKTKYLNDGKTNDRTATSSKQKEKEKGKRNPKCFQKVKDKEMRLKQKFKERAIEALEHEASISRDDVQVTFKKHGDVMDFVINLEPDNDNAVKDEPVSKGENELGQNTEREDSSVFKKPQEKLRVPKHDRNNLPAFQSPTIQDEDPKARRERLRQKAELSMHFRRRMSELQNQRRRGRKDPQENVTTNETEENANLNKNEIASQVRQRIAELTSKTYENEKEIRHIQRVLGRSDFPKDAKGEVIPHCLNCGRVREKLRVCVRCEIARYCNRSCQTKNYPEHKDRCIRLNQWNQAQARIPPAIEDDMAKHLLKFIRRFKLIPDQWMRGCGRALLAKVMYPFDYCGLLSARIEDMAGDVTMLNFCTPVRDYYPPGPLPPRARKSSTSLPFTATPIPLQRCLQRDMFVVVLAVRWHRYPDNAVGLPVYDIQQVFFIDWMCKVKLADMAVEETEV